MVQKTMAQIYKGRSFLLDGEALCPSDAFDASGALPLFAACASRRFSLAHGAGVRLERCLRCGNAAPPTQGVCHTPCPMRMGQHRIESLFGFDIAHPDPSSLIPVRLTLPPHRGQVYLALYFVLDAAQEVLKLSPSPRRIPIDDLVNDLAIVLRDDLNDAVEALRADHPVHAKSEAFP